ncbi:MAG: hypothetical protein J5725_13265 [Bacteroidales bacterium]|nr:hypothetical protein [Bacteroidales bacterium]
MKQYIEIHKIKCKEEIRNEGKRICRNCENFDEYDSIFDEEDNEDYFTLFCKVKGEVIEPDDEIADKCKDFVLKGENNGQT